MGKRGENGAMMKKATVNVIIPVYKTERYLQECVESVLKQDYPRVEIILVDDGSPDNCPALCDQYAQQYENVSVIHQQNSGQGISRNAGMTASDGEYIVFMDSDDCLDGSDAISRLVICAEEKGADIVVGGFRRFNESMTSEVNEHHLHDGDYTRTVDFRFKGFYMYGHLAYNWGKLYRRSFLEEHDLKCPSYPFTQDKAHNMMCCAYEPVYAFVEGSVYLYRVNESSVTYRYKENFMPVWISIAQDFRKFLQERRVKQKYDDLLAFHYVIGFFFLVKQELQFKKHGILESVKMLKKYGTDPFIRKAMLEMAKGKYINEISVFSWKVFFRVSSLLFIFHLYWLLVVGIALLRKMRIDERVTKGRYKKR